MKRKSSERYRKLVRPQQGRIIAGVCAGLGAYVRIDPTVVRIIFVLLAIPGGLPGVVPYIILWLLIPNE